MKSIPLIIFSFFVISFLPSCKNLQPLTDSMRKSHNWAEPQMKKIQFYLSEDVLLQREIPKGSDKIVHGKVKIVNNTKIEEITISKGTKGVLVQMPNDTKLFISFEISDSYFLTFGVNPSAGGKYVLLASDWNNNVGKVHYGDQSEVYFTDAKYAYLLVDLHQIDKSQRKSRTAHGRKVK